MLKPFNQYIMAKFWFKFQYIEHFSIKSNFFSLVRKPILAICGFLSRYTRMPTNALKKNMQYFCLQIVYYGYLWHKRCIKICFRVAKSILAF